MTYIKKVHRAAITTLTTHDGPINGHKKCSEYITKNVADLLEKEFERNSPSIKCGGS